MLAYLIFSLNLSISRYFDIILHTGKEIDIELAKIEDAIVAFSLYIGERKDFNSVPETYEDKHFLYSKASIDDLEIKLKSHKKPDNYEVIFSQDSQYISNMPIATYVDDTEAFTKQHNFFFENQINIGQLLLKERNIHNKKILRKITSLCNFSLSDATSEVKNICNSLDSFSISETKHYSNLILSQLYALAIKTDIRFIKLIELNYTNVYQQLNSETAEKKIKKIIVNTANQLYLDYERLQNKEPTNIVKIVEDLISIIHSDFTNPDLSLQNIASNYDISESYISRKFSEYMGISYVKYLTQIRINKAIELLNNDPNVTDIHIKCGYYNVQTFDTAFKKVTGFTVRSFLNRKNTDD